MDIVCSSKFVYIYVSNNLNFKVLKLYNVMSYLFYLFCLCYVYMYIVICIL